MDKINPIRTYYVATIVLIIATIAFFILKFYHLILFIFDANLEKFLESKIKIVSKADLLKSQFFNSLLSNSGLNSLGSEKNSLDGIYILSILYLRMVKDGTVGLVKNFI